MNILRMPTAGTPYYFEDILRALLGAPESEKILTEFQQILKEYLSVDNIRLVNSGTTANYILYELFKKIRKNPRQNEVILPAYTAPSLLLPIEKSGLKAVLVDIDENSFNLDFTALENAVTERTLAIMPVHMFGLPCDMDALAQKYRDKSIFIIEDGASALGSKLRGKHIGTLAPFGFYSLNRGKNISTLAGGIITWKNDEHSELLRQLITDLPPLSLTETKLMLFRMIGLSLAVRPPFYALFYPLISQFKYTTLHTHFDSFQYTTQQAAMGKQMWHRIDDLTQRRIDNGKALYKVFKDRPGFRLATIPADAAVAWNQFPVVCNDLAIREMLMKNLAEIGIETSTMYDHPLHHIFPSLNRPGRDPHPKATFLAEHLLLIPPHAQITRQHILKIKSVIDSIGH